MYTNLGTSATYILVNLAAFPPAIFCTRSVRSSPLSSVNCFDRSFFDLHHTVKPSCSPRYQTLPCSAGYVLGLELVRLDLAGHFVVWESADRSTASERMLLQLSKSTRVRARRDMSQHHGDLQTSPKPAAEGGNAIITLRSVVGVVRAWLGTRNTERGTILRVLCSSFSHTPTAAGTCLI